MTRTEFNEYVRMHSRKFYSFAFRILRNQEESEDAVQEIFIKLWNMGEKLDNYLNIDALAATMIRNYCIDQIRKRNNHMQSQIENVDIKLFTSQTPHQQLEDRESYDIIKKLMDGLAEKYKNVLILREIDGLSYEEIASETSQDINNLRVMLSRARAMLKNDYNKYNNEKRGTRQSAEQVL